jgi:hypothetical protein
MEQELSTIYTARLSNPELNSICHSTLNYARPVLAEIGPVASTAFATLETANNAMGEQMMKPRKSDLTPAITEAGKDRKNRWSEIIRNVSTAEKGREPVKKEAGRLLKLFLEPCWKNNSKPMNIQTSLFIELFDLYNNNPAMQANALTVGVDGMLTELEPVNLNYQTLTEARTSQDATDGPSASSLKTSVVKGYNDFCEAIEQALKYTPSAALTLLFEQIDELRREYAHLAMPEEEPEGQ